MARTPIGQLRADDEIGTYWTTPSEASLAEVHPLLMAVLLMLPGRQEWSVVSVEAYDMGSGGPIGSFDIAFDRRSGRACGYFNTVGCDQPMDKPLWFRSSGDENDFIEAFYLLMRDAGHVS
ncbi:hypothetical protein ACIQUB_30545 [Rhizobium sp. NPDC090275]|uniref:hypothetical protein n=1 Tax=Rhizobium sp. NPDC090275 TaxID=3364498 RepID=UPI00383A435D